MLNSLAILSCRIWIEKSAKTFRGEEITAGFMGRTELCRSKAAGWEKAAVSTKSFSVVFCRVHSNFSD